MIMEVLPIFLSSVVWYLCKPSSSDFTVQSTFGKDWKTFLVARTLRFMWVAPFGIYVSGTKWFSGGDVAHISYIV